MIRGQSFVVLMQRGPRLEGRTDPLRNGLPSRTRSPPPFYTGRTSGEKSLPRIVRPASPLHRLQPLLRSPLQQLVGQAVQLALHLAHPLRAAVGVVGQAAVDEVRQGRGAPGGVLLDRL